MIFAFDFDGTLVDTMPGLARAGIETMQLYHGAEYDEAVREYFRTIGTSFREQLEEIFPEDPVNDDAADYYWNRQLEVYSKVEEAFPGVYDAVDRLLDDGHICWVVTSSPRVLLERVVSRTLPPALRVLGRETGPKDKQLRRSAARFFFGDAPRDRGYADRAGVQFVPVGHRFPPPVARSLPKAIEQTLRYANAAEYV